MQNMNLLQRLLDRVLNEPVLLVALVLALGNLIGEDLSEFASFIESALVLLGGATARHFVSPVRSLDDAV